MNVFKFQGVTWLNSIFKPSELKNLEFNMTIIFRAPKSPITVIHWMISNSMGIIEGNDETKQFGTDAAMDEIDEIGGDLTLDVLISNKELSTRLVDLVMEVKEILQ